MKKETGGPAFPQASYNMKGGYDITGGMNLRDYFAAKAMQGILSSPQYWIGEDSQLVNAAYEMADAMLKEREK